MELRHLKYFMTVAEELNISRAARKLRIAQPPLSQQIRALEEEVGLKLFDRNSRGITLTAAGLEFLHDARQVLKSVDRLQQKSKLRSEGLLGKLSIGVIPTVINSDFGTRLQAFREKNPGIEISIADIPSNQQLELLLSGNLDVGFLRPNQTLLSTFESHILHRSRMRIAVPRGHRLAQKSRIDWNDLAPETFILVRPEAAPDYYEDFYRRCRQAGFEPRVQHYVNSVPAQFWLVTLGMGVAPLAILPEFVKREEVVLLELPDDAPIYHTAMVWRRGLFSTAQERFVNFLRASGDSL